MNGKHYRFSAMDENQSNLILSIPNHHAGGGINSVATSGEMATATDSDDHLYLRYSLR
jgi:hypothetical protein